MEDALERRNAECEFVTAAYTEEEAWVVRDEGGAPQLVKRRLCSSEGTSEAVSFVLELQLPAGYPASASLKISASVEENKTPSTLLKTAYNALSNLLQICREASESMPGEEAIFTVLSRADEWLLESWPSCISSKLKEFTPSSTAPPCSKPVLVLGRNLIYSHHIIGKKKRADMKELASELKLTGYCKVGWPGIILIEGEEHACHAFYDRIRRWAWQHLVLRGEMREELSGNEDVNSRRKFSNFLEVNDMSLVALHCRKVGLESLFLTSMKVYASSQGSNEDDEITPIVEILYGALVHVDHMNDGKAYRKWLRKTCQDLDVALLLKQYYPAQDFCKRSQIVVGLVGSRFAVSSVLKIWRTSLVDVDSRGKPCLERMMTVLIERELDSTIRPSSIDWDDLSSESQLNATKEKLIDMIRSTGIQSWEEAASLF